MKDITRDNECQLNSSVARLEKSLLLARQDAIISETFIEVLSLK